MEVREASRAADFDIGCGDRVMIRIAKYHTDFGNIEALPIKDSGSFIYRQGGCYQSECDHKA
ncbi:hypothetical protein ACVDG8_026630 [Mesorhizobium sp. ORM8.1]